MKYASQGILAGIIGALCVPLVVSASDGQEELINTISSWVAIGIGLFATITVYTHSRRIGGGVLSLVYVWFSAGMFLLVGGMLAEALPGWAPDFVATRTHDILFILGNGVMAAAARKILIASGLDK